MSEPLRSLNGWPGIKSPRRVAPATGGTKGRGAQRHKFKTEMDEEARKEVLVEVLRRKGKPVGYLLFSGEQHGFRKSTTREADRRTLANLQ